MMGFLNEFTEALKDIFHSNRKFVVCLMLSALIFIYLEWYVVAAIWVIQTYGWDVFDSGLRISKVKPTMMLSDGRALTVNQAMSVDIYSGIALLITFLFVCYAAYVLVIKPRKEKSISEK